MILDYEAEYAAALAEREEALQKAADEAHREEAAAAAAAAFAYAPAATDPSPSPYADQGEIDEEAVGGGPSPQPLHFFSQWCSRRWKPLAAMLFAWVQIAHASSSSHAYGMRQIS